MATKMFPHAAVATCHRGTNTAKLDTTTAFWVAKLLDTSQGTSATNKVTNTVNGATNGVEVTDSAGGLPLEWISEPLSADFTISGTITCNIRCAESSMSANVAINVVVDKIAATDGTITQIVKTARVTEEALTTETAANFTATPTSTACNRGDRLRVRIFGDDSTAATMATAFTFTVWYDGATGATGDTYIQFTENLTFEPAGDPKVFSTGVNIPIGAGNQSEIHGMGGTNEMYAQSFVCPTSLPILSRVTLPLSKTGAPTDNLVFEIQTDNGSATAPSGTVVGTVATQSGSGIGTGVLSYVNTCNIALTPGTTYWMVARRSGTRDDVNFFKWTVSFTDAYAQGGAFRSNSSTWVVVTGTPDQQMILEFDITPVYYLTDTAETINPGSATEKKALTTPGSGSTNAVTNTATGPVTPTQITASAGGTAIEWYTPPLNAVSLGGKAKFNIRGLESSASANASIKAEIAITAGDGSGATVWGIANIEAITTYGLVGELNISDTAYFAWVSGDDTSITDGQRLRFRIFVDDCGSGALVTAFTVTVTYGGATPSAAGDTYVILPVAVTEQIPAFAQPLPMPMVGPNSAVVRAAYW